MYTVNNTNFFDYGVDAGDAQLDVRAERRLFLLSTPIQFFGTPQSRLFVSHLCTPARQGMVATYTMNTLLHSLSHDLNILCEIFILARYKNLSKIFSTLSKFRQHILQTFINKFASFCFIRQALLKISSN